MMKKVIVATLAIALSFQAVAEIKPLNGIAVEVNSSIITHRDIQRVINELKSHPENKDIPSNNFVQMAQNVLVERALLTDAAHQMGLKVSEAQINAELVRRSAESNTNVNALYNEATKQGYQQKAYRLEIAKSLLIERMFANLTDNIQINEAQIDQAIKEASSLPQGEPYTVYTLRRLVLNANNQADMPAIGERMQQIARAVNQGTSFETLARRYSQEPQAANGGIHRDVTADMLPTMGEQLLSRLQVGQISTPFASGMQWQMFQLISSRTENNPVKMQREAIRRALLQAERQKVVQQFIGQLRQNAVIRQP